MIYGSGMPYLKNQDPFFVAPCVGARRGSSAQRFAMEPVVGRVPSNVRPWCTHVQHSRPAL